MLTLIIIVLILMAICRPRRYRGFGRITIITALAVHLVLALADTEVLAAHLALVQDGK